MVCPELPTLHFEVKRVQRGNPYDWMAQARRDCGGTPDSAGRGHPDMKIPVIAHKRNHSDWLAIIPMDQFLEIIRRSDLVAVQQKEGDICPTPCGNNS